MPEPRLGRALIALEPDEFQIAEVYDFATGHVVEPMHQSRLVATLAPTLNAARTAPGLPTIQAILGHVDHRSVEQYARLADQAVVEVLRGAEKARSAKTENYVE